MQIIGLDKALRKVTSIQRQIRFAEAQALNDTAKDVQGFEAQKEIQKLTVRRPWWKPGTRFGINIKFATRDRLVSVIGSQADWLREQEQGITKRATSHRLSVPTVQHKPKASIMARGKKPRAMRARRDVFVAKEAVWRRVTADRLPIIRLFSLVKSAVVKKSIKYVDNGVAVAIRTFKPNYEKRLKQAIATAR
jgi:hypothetical protein